MFKTLRCQDMVRCLGFLCLSSLLTLTVLATASEKAAGKQPQKNLTLKMEFANRAPAIRDFLWREMKNDKQLLRVGVVKFLVKIGNEEPSDNAGPLNWNIARRLEAALILALDASQEKTYRILHVDPKELMTSADHRTKEGRQAFFQGTKYDTAWGEKNEKLPADVILTGEVAIAEDARAVKVTVQAFDETGKDLKKVCCFPVVAESNLLSEAGMSFALSRGTDPKAVHDYLARMEENPEDPDELPPQAPVAKKQKNGVKPSEGPTVGELIENAPVGFEILYKKGEGKARPQRIAADGSVNEPTEDTEVTFRLWHKKQDDFTYGVVLRINGENSIYPEEREQNNFRAYKWIVEPKANYPILGYRKMDNKTEKFSVLSASESRLEELNYGLHAGTITLVIFQGQPDGKPAPKTSESKLAQGVDHGVPNELTGKPNQLVSLQNKILDDAVKQSAANGNPRGLIVPGEIIRNKVEEKEFSGYMKPVSTINIRYYKPHKEE